MILNILFLLSSAIVIYIACEYFVNAVEWTGQRLGVSKNAVGTILAAFGTALPESVVTFVAVVFGHNAAQKDIGVGSALGGPLVLGTIAYAVIGMVFLINRKKLGPLAMSRCAASRLSRDQGWFLSIFLFKVGLGLFAFAWKPWLGLLFLLAYAVYVWYEMRRDVVDEGDDEELEPLKFRPKDTYPSTSWALLQTTISLVAIFLSSQLFVHELEEIGPWLGMSSQMVSLLFSPIATELPEILNAVIWVRQGKYTLAFGNISGAMMIQATIPSALGVFFTPWILNHALVWAAGVTAMSIVGLYLMLRYRTITAGKLALFGLFYLLFAGGLFFI